MLFLCLRSRFYKHPSPKSDGEWCWVQSSVPASCINPALLDVGFIWELITLWQTRISMEGHKVFWFWWSAKAFVYRHGESFLGVGCMHPCVAKRKITLWWCELIWRYESIRLLLHQTFSCDSGQSLQTHLQPARPLHLPSLKLGISTEEYPRIWLPHINRCTTTQTHSQTQT